MTTVHLLAAINMNTIGVVSSSVISCYLSEAFQCLQRGWFSLSVTSSEGLKLLNTSLDSDCSLSAGASFKGNFSNHRL